MQETTGISRRHTTTYLQQFLFRFFRRYLIRTLLIEDKWAKLIENVRSCRGADIRSDYYPGRVDIRLQGLQINKKKNKSSKLLNIYPWQGGRQERGMKKMSEEGSEMKSVSEK